MCMPSCPRSPNYQHLPAFADRLCLVSVPLPSASPVQPRAPNTSKVVPAGRPLHKFYVDYSVPAADNVFDPASFEKFLHDRIKVDGKAGQLGEVVNIQKECEFGFLLVSGRRRVRRCGKAGRCGSDGSRRSVRPSLILASTGCRKCYWTSRVLLVVSS